jgi:hypothetical protein
MTNQGVNFQLPSGGQFSVAVDTYIAWAKTADLLDGEEAKPWMVPSF